MLEHDKINNRINVQIYGMTNRWIYYMEHDGMEFIKNLSNAKVNLAHRGRKIAANRNGKVEGLPCQCPLGQEYAKDWAKETTVKWWKEGQNDQTQNCQLERCGGTGRAFPEEEELKRGDPANGVYGFRVALQKESSIGQWITGMSVTDSILRDHFDAVSVRVYLKECKACAGTGNTQKDKKGNQTKSGHVRRTWLTLGTPQPLNDGDQTVLCASCGGKGFSNTVDYITIPNNIREKQADITKIDCFQSDAKTVVLRLKDVAGSKIINLRDSAEDRRLFLGCYAGKELLKFLFKHLADSHNIITDESEFKKFVAGIKEDWDTRPLLDQSKVTNQRSEELMNAMISRTESNLGKVSPREDEVVLDRGQGRPRSGGRTLAARLASYEAAYESTRW